MAIILAGRLSLALAHASLVTEDPISAHECERVLAEASLTNGGVQSLSQALIHEDATLHRAFAKHGIHINHSAMIPLTALISPRAHGLKRPGVATHRWRLPLPDGSLSRVREGFIPGFDVYVAAPALLLLLEARGAGFARLVAWATELCGSYARSDEEAWACAFGLPIISSRSAMAAWLDDFETKLALRDLGTGSKGIKVGVQRLHRAREALSFMHDRSASPMETVISTLLELPARRGGFGLGPLSLNKRVELSDGQQLLASIPFLSVDVFLEHARPNGMHVGIEYDSDEFHLFRSNTSEHAGNYDAFERMRVNVAQMSGLNLLHLTSDVLEDPVRFDEFCRQVRLLLGISTHYMSGETISKRLRVRAELGLPIGTYGYAA